MNMPFSDAEYQRRLHLTRKAMEEQDIELLFIEDPSNMAWLTGYDGWSFYVHQGVLVSHDKLPIWWGRIQDSKGAKRTVYMPHSHIYGYADDYVQSTSLHPMEDLASLIKNIGHETARVGVEMDNYYFSAKAFQTMQINLSAATLIDATGLVNWQRAVKSEEELAFMRKAAALSQAIIKRALDFIEPGIKKNHLVAEIYDQAIRGLGEDWGDYPAIVPLVPTGADASAPHLTWNGDTIRGGEGTFFEISGCYRRYHAPLCRTVFLGKPGKEMLNAEAALTQGLADGIEVARAGARVCDIADALYKSLRKHGIKREGRCGYPIGLSYPPDWGERTSSIRPGDQTELKPGMTFHFMPGLWMENWGLETTESIVIQKQGPAHCFSNIERKMFVKN